MIKLEFIRPFAGTMNTLFRLDKKGESTDVTWAMRGPQSYMGKIMSVFIDCDAMIGKDFETGLANLKAIAEKEEPAETAAKPETVEPATPE